MRREKKRGGGMAPAKNFTEISSLEGRTKIKKDDSGKKKNCDG